MYNNIKEQINNPAIYFSDVDNVPPSSSCDMKTDFDTQVRRTHLTKLIENLRDSFPAIETTSAFSIFNLSQLPKSESELDLHGESDTGTLFLSHCSSGPLASIDTLRRGEELQSL